MAALVVVLDDFRSHQGAQVLGEDLSPVSVVVIQMMSACKERLSLDSFFGLQTFMKSLVSFSIISKTHDN